LDGAEVKTVYFVVLVRGEAILEAGGFLDIVAPIAGQLFGLREALGDQVYATGVVKALSGNEKRHSLKDEVAGDVVWMGVGIDHQVRGVPLFDLAESLDAAARVDEGGDPIPNEDGVGEGKLATVLSVHQIDVGGDLL